MKKNDFIKICETVAKDQGAKAYPLQDYHIKIKGDEYGMPSDYPFPDMYGVVGVFNQQGSCIKVFVHTDFDYHYKQWNGKLLDSGDASINEKFALPVIIRGGEKINCQAVAEDLKKYLEKELKS